jgi:hypothetical protein
VRLLDASTLLHAYDPDFRDHERSRSWLERAFSESGRIGLAWIALLAFLRIGTNPRAFRRPFSIAEASDIVSEWLDRTNTTVLEPGERHWAILSGLLAAAQARADLVTDAHIAALALEHGAVLCTDDRDFARFPGLRLENPLEG